MIKLLLFLIGLIFPSKENTQNRNQASVTIHNSLELGDGNGGNGHGNGGSTGGNTGQTPPPFTQPY
ncbi:hypothetical protein, partial [Paraburkholderia sp. SIMBA_027]|uniref:hypothetical protein n=1 Tax=Paraburkholderia sp. SIMBA_027 TaxID=3085770 RepID=UPI00397C514E